MLIETVAIDENTFVTMITKKIDDVELIYNKETLEGTIFWEEIEIECKVTANVLLGLNKIKDAIFTEKLALIQKIERSNRNYELLMN